MVLAGASPAVRGVLLPQPFPVAEPNPARHLARLCEDRRSPWKCSTVELDPILLTTDPQALDEAFSPLQRSNVTHYERTRERFTLQRLADPSPLWRVPSATGTCRRLPPTPSSVGRRRGSVTGPFWPRRWRSVCRRPTLTGLRSRYPSVTSRSRSPASNGTRSAG